LSGGGLFRLSAAALAFAVSISGQAPEIANFHVQPLRPLQELRKEALAAAPPVEKGNFLAPDLVDLATLGADFHFDIRYATKNNFLSAPFYSEARAFLERPAAQALVRAAAELKTHGFGVLIHDGYRPWYVTKMFWDATPKNLHTFVADPEKGSKHNRGCAVDLSLYDLKTGKPAVMPSGYDEMTERAHPYYKGGSQEATQRRDLLRTTMEAHGFRVDPGEWWHFDYREWPRYPIVNTPFERLPR
jgi:D-alanyl-D-alanine dipeptidase